MPLKPANNMDFELLYKFRNLMEAGLPFILGGIAAVIMPILPFLVVVTLLTISDLFTGIKAAKKKGEKTTDYGIRRTLIKLAYYYWWIILSNAVYIVYKIPGLFQDNFSFAYVVSAIIVMAEFKSNSRNLGILTGIKAWHVIGDFLPSYFHWTLKKKFRNKEEEPKEEK